MPIYTTTFPLDINFENLFFNREACAPWPPIESSMIVHSLRAMKMFTVYSELTVVWRTSVVDIKITKFNWILQLKSHKDFYVLFILNWLWCDKRLLLTLKITELTTSYNNTKMFMIYSELTVVMNMESCMKKSS